MIGSSLAYRRNTKYHSFWAGCISLVPLPLSSTEIRPCSLARPVPYALRPRVETALKRLESEGILNKVKLSDWANPIVPVVKPNGDVQICGDFKVTVNPQLQTEQHPLPRIDDIFTNLAGGKKFTKIDLRQAYHQMEVEEESQDYLTINTHQGLY